MVILTAEDSREMLVARLRRIVEALALALAEIEQVQRQVRIAALQSRWDSVRRCCMNGMKSLVVCAVVFLAVFSGSATAATDPLSKANRLPPSLEQKVQDFQRAVTADGYEVARGYLTCGRPMTANIRYRR